jgi:hypothetical protein
MFLLKVLVKRAGQPMSTACPHGMGNGSRSINDDIASVSSPALAAVVCAHTIRRHSSNRGFQLNAVQLGDRAACMHARRSIAWAACTKTAGPQGTVRGKCIINAQHLSAASYRSWILLFFFEKLIITSMQGPAMDMIEAAVHLVRITWWCVGIKCKCKWSSIISE